LETQVL